MRDGWRNRVAGDNPAHTLPVCHPVSIGRKPCWKRPGRHDRAVGTLCQSAIAGPVFRQGGVRRRRHPGAAGARLWRSIDDVKERNRHDYSRVPPGADKLDRTGRGICAEGACARRPTTRARHRNKRRPRKAAPPSSFGPASLIPAAGRLRACHARHASCLRRRVPRQHGGRHASRRRHHPDDARHG